VILIVALRFFETHCRTTGTCKLQRTYKNNKHIFKKDDRKYLLRLRLKAEIEPSCFKVRESSFHKW